MNVAYRTSVRACSVIARCANYTPVSKDPMTVYTTHDVPWSEPAEELVERRCVREQRSVVKDEAEGSKISFEAGHSHGVADSNLVDDALGSKVTFKHDGFRYHSKTVCHFLKSLLWLLHLH